jgi:hypothetical protein
VVLELESLKDYRLEHADDAVRIAFGTDRGFAAWSSVAPAALLAPRAFEPVAQPARGPVERSTPAPREPLVPMSFKAAAQG